MMMSTEMRYEGYRGYLEDIDEIRMYRGGEEYRPNPLFISTNPALSKLARGLSVDMIAATCTAAIVAPVSAFLDRGITESAAGKKKLWLSVYESAGSALARPGAFLSSPQFLYPMLLYFGTYGVANASETICDTIEVDRTVPQLVTSTGANMALSMAKDGAFARIYGLAVPTALPAASYGFWFGRDVLSMFFFFTLPPLITSVLDKNKESTVNTNSLSPTTGTVALTAALTASAARFLAPVIAQFFTTPLHLLGLDTYNRRNVSFSDRISFLKTEFPVAIGARIGRIIPAYSFGGVCNASIRKHGAQW